MQLVQRRISGFQGRYKELNWQIQHLPQQAVEVLAVEFSCRIIHKQCRGGRPEFGVAPQLSQQHRCRHQFLLPARHPVPCRFVLHPNLQISALRPGVC